MVPLSWACTVYLAWDMQHSEKALCCMSKLLMFTMWVIMLAAMMVSFRRAGDLDLRSSKPQAPASRNAPLSQREFSCWVIPPGPAASAQWSGCCNGSA